LIFLVKYSPFEGGSFFERVAKAIPTDVG